jgi:hypothetical protein
MLLDVKFFTDDLLLYDVPFVVIPAVLSFIFLSLDCDFVNPLSTDGLFVIVLFFLGYPTFDCDNEFLLVFNLSF